MYLVCESARELLCWIKKKYFKFTVDFSHHFKVCITRVLKDTFIRTGIGDTIRFLLVRVSVSLPILYTHKNG